MMRHDAVIERIMLAVDAAIVGARDTFERSLVTNHAPAALRGDLRALNDAVLAQWRLDALALARAQLSPKPAAPPTVH